MKFKIKSSNNFYGDFKNSEYYESIKLNFQIERKHENCSINYYLIIDSLEQLQKLYELTAKRLIMDFENSAIIIYYDNPE